MAEEPKSRPDRILEMLEMLRNPTPEQLAVLTGGRVPNLPEIAKALHTLMKGLGDRLPDREAAERIVRNAEWLKQQVEATRLVPTTPAVTVQRGADTSTPRSMKDKLQVWLQQKGAALLPKSDSAIARQWAREAGAGVKVTSHHRGVVSDWREQQPKAKP